MIIWSSTSPYPWDAKDKQQHLFAGAACGLAALLYLLTVPTPHGWALIVATATFAGLAKEVSDLRNGAAAEVADFLNTVLGGIIVALCYLAAK